MNRSIPRSVSGWSILLGSILLVSAAGCSSGSQRGVSVDGPFLLAAIDPAETISLGPPENRVVARFSFEEGVEGFAAGPQVEGLAAEGGRLVFRSTGDDPHVIASGLDLEAGAIDRMVLDITVSRFGSMPSVYWATDAAAGFSEERRQYFTLDRSITTPGELQTATVDLEGHPGWSCHRHSDRPDRHSGRSNRGRRDPLRGGSDPLRSGLASSPP